MAIQKAKEANIPATSISAKPIQSPWLKRQLRKFTTHYSETKKLTSTTATQVM
jgi:hypothetical protein